MSTTVDQATWLPPQPHTLEETRLRPSVVTQLLLKALHVAGDLSGIALADQLGLAFSVLESGIEALKAQQFCEIVGGTAIGPPSYRYRITTLGHERAAAAFEANTYTGVAPVTFEDYRDYLTNVFAPTTEGRVGHAEIEAAFSHLVLSDRVLEQLGPAINAGHSLFVYGPPGNGKTVIAQAIGNLLHRRLWIPHAVEVDGSIIQVFDPGQPRAAAGTGAELPGLDRTDALRPPLGALPPAAGHRRRRADARRPRPDLQPDAGFYRAPVQLLANGGVLIIDDFGRQRCYAAGSCSTAGFIRSKRGVDYLTLQSGQKIGVPFLVLPVFATNIKPVELVDEAFLRRIHYKVLARESDAGRVRADLRERLPRRKGSRSIRPSSQHLWTPSVCRAASRCAAASRAT